MNLLILLIILSNIVLCELTDFTDNLIRSTIIAKEKWESEDRLFPHDYGYIPFSRFNKRKGMFDNIVDFSSVIRDSRNYDVFMDNFYSIILSNHRKNMIENIDDILLPLIRNIEIDVEYLVIQIPLRLLLNKIKKNFDLTLYEEFPIVGIVNENYDYYESFYINYDLFYSVHDTSLEKIVTMEKDTPSTLLRIIKDVISSDNNKEDNKKFNAMTQAMITQKFSDPLIGNKPKPEFRVANMLTTKVDHTSVTDHNTGKIYYFNTESYSKLTSDAIINNYDNKHVTSSKLSVIATLLQDSSKTNKFLLNKAIQNLQKYGDNNGCASNYKEMDDKTIDKIIESKDVEVHFNKHFGKDSFKLIKENIVKDTNTDNHMNNLELIKLVNHAFRLNKLGKEQIRSSSTTNKDYARAIHSTTIEGEIRSTLNEIADKLKINNTKISNKILLKKIVNNRNLDNHDMDKIDNLLNIADGNIEDKEIADDATLDIIDNKLSSKRNSNKDDNRRLQWQLQRQRRQRRNKGRHF